MHSKLWWAAAVAAVVGWSCDREAEPVRQDLGFARAAVLNAPGPATRRFGESCKGPKDCRTGLCLHMDHNKPPRAPDQQWFCSMPCTSKKDCGNASFECVEWYPGQRACVGPQTWASKPVGFEGRP